MIRVISTYEEIPAVGQLLKIMGDQMSHIGSVRAAGHLETVLRNALKSDSRVRLFLSISDKEELQGFAFTNICSGLESGADYLWLNELHIAGRFRRKGFAEELLDFIEDWAARMNMPYMACITSSSNTPARKLYRKKGFEVSETLWVDKALEPHSTMSPNSEPPSSFPDIQSINIRHLQKEEAPPMPLLLNADPSQDLVEDYLSRGLCLVAELGNEIIGALILMSTGKSTMEIMNVSVSDSMQNRGIGTALISRAVEEAKSRGTQILEIGTGNPGFGQLYLYQKCGFRISGVDRDFFRRNYPERIYENGLECRDMIRLTMEFK